MENIRKSRRPSSARIVLESQGGAYSAVPPATRAGHDLSTPVVTEKSRATRGTKAREVETLWANTREFRRGRLTGNASAPPKKLTITVKTTTGGVPVQIRGLRVDKARDVLKFSPIKAAVVVRKAVLSAIANAECNQGAGIEEITSIIDKAVSLKRFTARAKKRVEHRRSSPSLGQVAEETLSKIGIAPDPDSVRYLSGVLSRLFAGEVPPDDALAPADAPTAQTMAVDPLATARARGRLYAAKAYESADNLTLLDARSYAGRNERTINEERQRGDLYALLPAGKTRGFRYPKWQFDAEPDRLRTVLRPFVEVESSCWVIHSFFERKRDVLGGKSPAEVVLDRSGDIQAVVDLARRELDGEQGAA